MLIRSPAFSDGATIPRQYTCEGEDLSPPVEWSGLPPGTQSLALLCDDPDAPAGTWHHWAAYDIPANSTGLPEGAGQGRGARGLKQGVNDFGRVGYGGPCPPATRPTTITSGCSRSRPTAYSFSNSRPPWMSNARRASMCLPRQRSLESTSADHVNVNGPENLAILLKLALNMLRTRPTRLASVPRDEHFLLSMLAQMREP